MAILHFINSKKTQTASGMLFVLRYTMQDKKTVADDGKKYVTGVNCTPQSAYTEFNNTKRLYGKTDKRLYYHFVQSFSVDENISPQTAHEIALRFAEEAEKLHGFEIVVSTHCDRDHIHSHFVMNSVNAETGKKFHISESEIEMLMRISDNICREYGLSVIEPKPITERAKPMSDREYRSAENGQSWKIRLAITIDDAMLHAISREHFIELMSMEGYAVRWTNERKYITYTTPVGFRCRDNKLHEEKYLKGNMEHEFRIRKEILTGIERSGQTADEVSFESRTLRSGDRAKLESYDHFTEYADRNVVNASRRDRYSGNKRRNHRAYESADERAEEIFRREQNDHRTVSDENGECLYGLHYEDRYGGEEYGDTGWEYERSIFERDIFGTRGDEALCEEAALGFNDTYRPSAHVGVDAAYMVADLTNILDNDHQVEDCTTMHFPTEHKKNRGPVMGGM